MTMTKPMIAEDEAINPNFVYRTHSPIVINVIGLGPSQQKVAVENGDLPPPFELTSGGKARGYYGSTLLEIKAKRIAAAEAKAARLREKRSTGAAS